MLWHALPPEVNTARLMAGAGPAPMLQAAAGWEALGSALEAQAVELGTTLAALQGMWTGAGSERAIAAATPMIAWLQDAAGKAQQRALQASAQAAAYVTALATTPTLIEIVVNHVTHAVLVATNFLGINLMPIGFNEMDYFGRMWMQAAAAMDVYQAETMVNTFFEPMLPMKPILVPEVGQAMSEALNNASQLFQSAGPAALRQLAAAAEDAADVVPNSLGLDEQTMAMLSQLGQLGQQLGGPMQQLMQPIQQFASMGGQGGGMGGSGMGGGLDGPAAGGAGLGDRGLGQMGLLGANPLSNHPLAGGSGPSVGLGMMHAEALPGAAGSDPRTSLMSQLLDKAELAPAGAGAGSSAAGGAAPMGGMGAGAGAAAQSGGGNRSAVPAPAMVAEQSDEPVHEGFDDGDDW